MVMKQSVELDECLGDGGGGDASAVAATARERAEGSGSPLPGCRTLLPVARLPVALPFRAVRLFAPLPRLKAFATHDDCGRAGGCWDMPPVASRRVAQAPGGGGVAWHQCRMKLVRGL
ncbi:unnamed protein product [Lampetra fluviatilis]